MAMTCYVSRKFSAGSMALIDKANEILTEYDADGYVITLRQLYYQFVSRDLIANKQKEYKRLGSVINDARLAGLIDWDLMEDRTRNLQSPSTWDNPAEIVAAVAEQFKTDLWATQPYRPEVWIEKDALAGVFERVCAELRVPYFSCRGYTSQSEMYSAAMRLRRWIRKGQSPIIFHFGDHDPSGIDMSRDIVDRLNVFGSGCEFHRLALNMDQVEQYDPPPNPAKQTDSRFDGYIASFGNESWELDALEPRVLADLVRRSITGIQKKAAWHKAVDAENEHRRLLGEVSANWADLTKDL